MEKFDPLKIHHDAFPLICFTDQASGLMEFLIKWRTNSSYNHVMWATRPDVFASQGNTYSEVAFKRYMRKNSRLKFVEVIGLTPVQKNLLLASIRKKLQQPWWKKRYDWLGIAGQAIGLRWINTPWLNYCSEDVPQHLKFVAEKGMPNESILKQIIDNIPQHTSPEDLNIYLKLHPEYFKILGRWEGDQINTD